MRHTLIVFASNFIFSLFSHCVLSQVVYETTGLDSLAITNIVIVGNDHTKDHVILREMKVKVGDPYDEERVEEDRKRIQNLQLFTRVEIKAMRSDAGVVLLVWVAERWYIFPVPILFINEHDWKKLSYGASLLYENFRGRDETIYASSWFVIHSILNVLMKSIPGFLGRLESVLVIIPFFQWVSLIARLEWISPTPLA